MASGAKTSKVPITLLTGFLGAGKTTTLNHILTAQHGKKLAVIENEFGEIGLDEALIKQKTELKGSLENNYCVELMNGCICCSVRQDLADAIGQMLEMHKNGKLHLDGILIETTGVADPGPVVQTFYTESFDKETGFLDGVVTVADAKFVSKHLDEKKGIEAMKQIAYADRIILNKIDLVNKEEKAETLARIRKLNSSALVIPATQGKVDPAQLLGIKAFVFDRIAAVEKEEELEGVTRHDHTHKCDEHCDHDHGHDHSHKHGHGHDHSHKHGHGHDHDHKHGHAKDHDHKHESHGKEKHSHDHDHKQHGSKHHHGHHGKPHDHNHDAAVFSVGVVREGNIDHDVMCYRLQSILALKGEDVYRMKGILSIEGQAQSFVLQGVHELWDLQPGTPWKEGESRVNKIIFIGRKLNRDQLKKEVEGWIVGTERQRVFRSALEDMWAEEDDSYAEMWKSFAPQTQTIEYEVSVHNGVNGMGLVFTELSTGGVFVTKFVAFPKPHVNTALQSGKIWLGDQLIGLQGLHVEACSLDQLVAVVRRFRRGAGASGDNIVLRFRREAGGYTRENFFRALAPPVADLPLAPSMPAASTTSAPAASAASASATDSVPADASSGADPSAKPAKRKAGADGDVPATKKKRYGC